MIDQTLIYEELGLLPLWLSKNEATKEEKIIYACSKIIFNKKVLLFLAPIRQSAAGAEHKLYENIISYLNSIADKKSEIKILSQELVKAELIAEDIFHLFLLGKLGHLLDNQSSIEKLKIPFTDSSLLSELVESPDKKKKLWQDIQAVLKTLI